MSDIDGICRNVRDPYIEHQCELPPESLAERKKEEPKEMAKLVGAKALEQIEHELKKEGIKILAKHVVPQGLKGLGGAGAAALLKGATAAIKGTDALKYISDLIGEQGKKRGVAVSRENHDLAMNFVAFEARPDALPKGYLEARRETLMGPNGKIGDDRHSPHVVNAQIEQIEEGLEANEPGMVAYRDAWVSGLQRGEHAAYAAGVKDDATLEAARGNASFDASYQTDPAFREGVRAAAWQAKHHPEDFAAEKAKLASLDDARLGAAVRRTA